MGTRIRPRKTVEDLMALPEETRAELIGGEIYAAAAPSTRHQRVVVRLVRLLAPLEEHAGVVLPAPFDVHLPSGDVVQPDLVYVGDARRLSEDGLHGVPDLAIEIVSPANADRDRVVKRLLYERNRVPEYWIVEPEDGAVQVLRLKQQGYVPAGYYTPGTVLRAATLPDFESPVDDIFA